MNDLIVISTPWNFPVNDDRPDDAGPSDRYSAIAAIGAKARRRRCGNKAQRALPRLALRTLS
jgi:hypothetical protein